MRRGHIVAGGKQRVKGSRKLTRNGQLNIDPPLRVLGQDTALTWAGLPPGWARVLSLRR